MFSKKDQKNLGNILKNAFELDPFDDFVKAASFLVFELKCDTLLILDIIDLMLKEGTGLERLAIYTLKEKKLFGESIGQLLYEVCGSDMERFIYHILMELPYQETGEFGTDPFFKIFLTHNEFDHEIAKKHIETRKFGKPNSLWALKNPPTDPHYEYPIEVE